MFYYYCSLLHSFFLLIFKMADLLTHGLLSGLRLMLLDGVTRSVGGINQKKNQRSFLLHWNSYAEYEPKKAYPPLIVYARRATQLQQRRRPRDGDSVNFYQRTGLSSSCVRKGRFEEKKMACSAIRSPILRNQTVRHYAVAAVAQHAPTTLSDVQVLSNKVAVAAVENNSPVAQVSIVIRAGSRNEAYETQGLNHLLRLCAGLTTSRSSTFGITRNIQQLGGNLTAIADRETIAYTLQVTRDKLGGALKFLEDVATHQTFRPWEVADQDPRMRYELSTLPETTRIVELLHKAAYRTGLGYSLYAPKRQIGKISSEALQHYYNTWFSGSRCAVVSTGVSLGEVSAFAANLKLPGGENSSPGTKYWGGEIRKERNSELATVAVAVEGSGLDKEKDVLAFAVLQQVAGTGPRTKWGTSTAPLHKTVASAAGSDPFAVAAFNASYSDSGLFGFVLSAPAGIAGSLTKAAYKWLRSPTITEADVTRGKNDLKAAILFGNDNNAALLESLGQQVILKGRVTSPLAIANEVDKISANDVKSVASRLSGKVSLAAIGDLSTVPFVDQLS